MKPINTYSPNIMTMKKAAREAMQYILSALHVEPESVHTKLKFMATRCSPITNDALKLAISNPELYSVEFTLMRVALAVQT